MYFTLNLYAMRIRSVDKLILTYFPWKGDHDQFSVL